VTGRRDDVEALAEVIGDVPFQGLNNEGCAHRLYNACSHCTAEAVLASDWFAQQVAEAEARGRAEVRPT